MAWVNGKRTVTCRVCWEHGHNRRNCPKLSPEMKDSYKIGDRARKCSWCKGTGHTKPRCEKRKGEMVSYIKENAVYRQNVLNALIHEGIGVGALVMSSDHDANDNSLAHVYLVKNIDWDKFQQKSKGARPIQGEGITSGWGYEFQAPRSTVGADYYGWSYPKSLSKVSRDAIMESVPEGWLDGTSGIERYFK